MARTIVFTDIESSTLLLERIGDSAWVGLLHEHRALVADLVGAHDGRVVKSQGDGFMLCFACPRAAVSCAVAIQRAVAWHGAQVPEATLRVRIGGHVGEVVAADGDVFGHTVVVASRLARLARGGELLVSATVRDLAGGCAGFGPARAVALRGLSDRLLAVPVWWAPAAARGAEHVLAAA